MINEWIEQGLHPITGVKEDFKSMGYKQRSKAHIYDYEFDVTLPSDV